jgi:hypothetical protein
MTTSNRTYITVSATVFTIVALAQAYRAFAGIELDIAGNPIPVAASWVAALVVGALAAWGWRTR